MIHQAISPSCIAISQEMHAALQERLATGMIDVPMLPEVVWQIMDMTASEDVDARQLADLIHRDQALASHIVRVANSPAYMSRSPIVSLQHAISRLGTKQLGEIAFAVSVHGRVFHVLGYAHDVHMLWQHAVGTATYASEIARMLRHNVEGAFLCGLLHDIGKPIILQRLVDFQRTLQVVLPPPVVAAMMEAYHAQVGGQLATQWSLPPHVHESILYHHDYVMAPTCGEAAVVTCFADHLVYHLMEPEVFDQASVYAHPVLAELRLAMADVTTLLRKQERVLHVIEAMGW